MCAKTTKPFSRMEKNGSIDLWRDNKVWAWMKFKLREFSCSNMEE
jgi:hypothetical protein